MPTNTGERVVRSGEYRPSDRAADRAPGLEVSPVGDESLSTRPAGGELAPAEPDAGEKSSPAEPAAGAEPASELPRWFRAMDPLRRRIYRWRGGPWFWRSIIGFVGLLVVVVGIVLLPLPGPGWLIIFGGIAIWSTEFSWASRLLEWTKRLVRRGTDWFKRQFHKAAQ